MILKGYMTMQIHKIIMMYLEQTIDLNESLILSQTM